MKAIWRTVRRLGSLLSAFLSLWATSLPALAAADHGKVASKTVEIDGAFGHLRLSDLAASGTALSPEGLARLFDPLRSADLDAQFAGAGADSISIAHLRLAQAGTVQITLDRVEIRGLHDGRIASLEIAGMSAGFGPQPVPFATGALKITGLDLAVLLNTIGGSMPDSVAPAGALCDGFSIDDVHLLFEALKTAKIYGSKLRTRPLLVPPANLLANYRPRTRSTEWIILAAADVLRSIDAETLGFSGFSFGDRAAHGGLTVDRVEIGHLAGPKLGTFTIKSFDADASPIAFGFDAAVWEGVDFTAAAAMLERAHGVPAPKIVTATPAALIPGARRNVIDHMRFVLGSMPGLVPGKPVETIGALAIARMEIDQTDAQAVYHVVGTLDHLITTLPPDGFSPQVAILRRAGLSDLDVSARIETKWDRPADTFELGPLTVSAAGLATVRADFRLADLGPGILSSDEAISDAAIAGARFESMSLHIENTSLVQKLAALGETALGEKPDDVRGRVLTAARAIVDTGLEGTPAAARIDAAIEAFLHDPRSLDITIGAAGPLPLRDLSTLLDDPAALASRLSVEATANGVRAAPH